MKFPEFNRIVNPSDEACYIANVMGKAPKAVKFQQVTTIAKHDSTLEIHWTIPKGFIVIETRQDKIVDVIKAHDLPLFVFKDYDTVYIVAKTSFNRTTKNNLLACGITANTYAYSKQGTHVKLPFKSKNNVSSTLDKMTIEHGKDIQELPSWLQPMRKISHDIADGIDLPITSNAKSILINTLKRLKSKTRQFQEEVLNFMNTELNSQPLSSVELNNILDISEEQVVRQFFDKDTFKHNKLGDYIIEHCNIKRDRISRELYYFDEKHKIYSSDTDYIMGYMTRLAPSLKNYQKEEVVKYIKNYLFDESVEFNTNIYTVVFNNGILDLRTMKLEPMTPDHLESIKINANYNPNAYSKTADQYFATATAGDKKIEQLLYETIGYSMLKTNALQKAFILVGGGRNGKSTFLDLVKAVLGKENTTSISFKDLSSNFRASALNNKLASIAGDISTQPISDSDLVKSITSGEDVMIEEKYKQAHAKSLFSTLMFACNKLPRTPDTSEGFYRRWTIIPFIADLSKVSRVKGMRFASKLMEQDSLDYVAYKAIHAIHNVLNTTEEFTEPDAVKDMLHQYKVDNSTVLSWFKENFNNDKKKLEKMEAHQAYVNYSNWCANSGRMKSSITNFVKSVKLDIGIDFQEKQR